MDVRFYPSKAKSIADKIIADELQNVTYDEEDAKIWSLNISDKVREAVYGILHPKPFQLFFSNLFVLSFVVDSLSKARYKVVVQTVIGQLKDQGIRVASRCLWDPNTDNYTACQFSNVRQFFEVINFRN